MDLLGLSEGEERPVGMRCSSPGKRCQRLNQEANIQREVDRFESYGI